jgi:hypothetical protein
MNSPPTSPRAQLLREAQLAAQLARQAAARGDVTLARDLDVQSEDLHARYSAVLECTLTARGLRGAP